MEKIVIHNLGPIEHIEFDVNHFNVFIGPQASGKSTLAKAVFYFKSLPHEFLNALLERHRTGVKSKMNVRHQLRQLMASRFLNIWGASTLRPDMQMKFYSEDGRWLAVIPSDAGRVTYSYDDEKFGNDLDNLQKYCDKHSISEIDLDQRNKTIAAFEENLRPYLKDLFQDKIERAYYIPAGRSSASSLSKIIEKVAIADLGVGGSKTVDNLPPTAIDETLRRFLSITPSAKQWFEGGFEGLVEEMRGMEEPSKEKALSTFSDVSQGILRGDYKYDDGTDKLYYSDNESDFVRLSFASSGQQEALWILVILMILLHFKNRYFIVIEEPEAHLFPDVQRDIVNAIAYFYKNSNSQIMLTTHSPYILTSVNNLIFANAQGLKYPEKVSEIVSPDLWLNHLVVSCFHLKEGSMSNIIDHELEMIKVDEIDKVSYLINREFDKLAGVK